MIETLNNQLQPMNLAAARGIRDEYLDIPRKHFRTTDDGTSDHLDVFVAGGGIIAVTENYESEDSAWSGSIEDQDVIYDLVDEGVLREE